MSKLSIFSKKVSGIVFFSFMFIITYSCNIRKGNDFVSSRYMELYKDVKGKKIENFRPLKVLLGMNSLFERLSGRKILVFINTGCVSCFQSMDNWSELITDNNIENNVKVYFVASGELNDYFKQVVEENDYPFSILHDLDNRFLNCNGLTSYQRGTFMLDSENSIILTGSPFEDDQLLNMYMTIILQK